VINILIAEDQPWTRKGLIQMINCHHLGIEYIEEADNGLDAIKRIEQGGIHLLLSDIRMPGMDGLELSRLVQERFPDIKVVILSGHNEFEYAQKAIRYRVKDYLLKPIQASALNQTLEQVIGELNEGKERDLHIYRMILRQLLEGSLIRETDPIGLFSDAFSNSWKRIIRIQNGDGMEQGIFDDYIHAVQQAIRHCPFSAIALNLENEWLMMLTAEQPFDADILEKLFTDYMHDIPLGSIRIGLGTWYLDPDLTWISDIESILALQLSPNKIFCEYSTSLLTDVSHKTIDSQLLWNSFEQRELTKMNHLLVQWFPETSTQSEIRFRCILLIKSILYRITMEDSLKVDYFFLLNRLKYMIKSSSHSAREMIQWVIETFRRSFEVMVSSEEKNGEQIVGWCQSYIMNNLSDDIHLSYLADKVHFSASHLSNLFKQITGKNYIDYVTELKINRALTYLESNMKINDIALKLGYVDSRYFSKLFRRIVGSTPSEYKLNKIKEKDT
jgi:two-component system, response regulator YesN